MITIIKIGDLNSWLNKYKSECFDALCCTTNMIVKNNGELVMGAGIAKVIAERHNHIPKNWGYRTLMYKNQGINSSLLVNCINAEPYQYLISFPTKYNWQNNSHPELIRCSCQQLASLITTMGWTKVLLPKPGCSNGGLNWVDVEKIVNEELDERVTVFEK
jgi:hypothetical protein